MDQYGRPPGGYGVDLH